MLASWAGALWVLLSLHALRGAWSCQERAFLSHILRRRHPAAQRLSHVLLLPVLRSAAAPFAAVRRLACAPFLPSVAHSSASSYRAFEYREAHGPGTLPWPRSSARCV